MSQGRYISILQSYSLLLSFLSLATVSFILVRHICRLHILWLISHLAAAIIQICGESWITIDGGLLRCSYAEEKSLWHMLRSYIINERWDPFAEIICYISRVVMIFRWEWYIICWATIYTYILSRSIRRRICNGVPARRKPACHKPRTLNFLLRYPRHACAPVYRKPRTCFLCIWLSRVAHRKKWVTMKNIVPIVDPNWRIRTLVKFERKKISSLEKLNKNEQSPQWTF
jgi:hypothetical protein